MANSDNISNRSGRIIQYNSSGLPKVRCNLIKRDLLAAIKPLLLLLDETLLTETGNRNIGDLLELEKFGYNFKCKNRPSGCAPGGGR